jgi:GNAT superfamily N-acetyltransferase
MPLPPDDIRAKLAQLRNEFAMRAALQSEYDKEMSGKYIHEMIPFADWLAQRNAPTGKAKGGLVWNSPDWKPHPENDLLQPIGASRMIGDERLLSQDDTFSHGLSEFPSSKKSYRYLYHGEDNKPIGAMQIQTAGPRSKKAVIQNLYVAEANRRQGIASKLLDRAREDFDVKHSTDLTTAGRAFARAKKASGGSVPSLDVMRLAIGGQGPRNFLKGTVEKVIDPLKQPEIYDPGLQYELHKNAINKWIESNLANYIRKQMGHPNDPVRKLAEEGILHFDPEALGVEEEQAEGRRQMLGGQKLAKGPLAQAWENAVDYQFEPNTVEDIKAMPDVYKGMHEPWMDKVDPKTPLYELYEADRLGFDHIVDILKEDLAQGRIRPEQLSKVSIEQAVRRAHEVDQANKKAMAEASIKTTEGMPVHKDYGDGFKWIELAMPEMPKELPEGWTMKVPKAGLMRASKPDPVDPRNDITRLGQDLPELIKNIYYRHPETPGNPFQKLKDALAYESDVMGHCVGGERLPDGTRTGGYANDVKAGNTRIFSLRDAKNEPHVTVEVKPNQHLDFNKWWGEQPKELRDEINARARRGEHKGSVYEAPEYLSARAVLPPAIKQIKGKGNAKPKKDYIPYVQDFVRSGNWSEVNDFRNTDLIRKSDLIDKFSPEELDAVGKGEYLTHGEHSDLLLKALQPPKGKAHGGITHAHHLEIEERRL